MGKLIQESEFFKKLFKKFDKGMIAHLDHFNKTMNVAIEKVEKRLKICEKTIHTYVKKTKKACDNDLNLAEVLVNKELRSKIIMSQWTNKYLSATQDQDLDPITFALSRFSLNICLSYKDVSPAYLLEISVHKHLVDYTGLRSELVVGPAMMALVHVSLYPEMKAEIVAAGALPVLLRVMLHCKSKAILAQCVKLCASLALENSNKTLMAQSGCVHLLFDLILGVHVDVDDHITYSALCGIVNVIYKNDANRMLAVEINGIKPILTTLRTCSSDHILTQGILALANIAYGNPYTANCILVLGGGEAFMEILQSGDIARQPVIAHAAMSALANICNSEVNQSHIGSINGLIECVIRVCEYAREVYLVTAAANFMLACCWKNIINKARIANKGGCTILMKRIMRHATVQSVDHVMCTEKLCLTLSSVLLYNSNHERMQVIGGLEEIIRLGKIAAEPIIIRALSKIIVTLVPSPDDLLRLHKDGSRYPVEKLGALPVLKKAKFKGFAHMPVAPEWLEKALQVLTMSDDDLRNQPIWIKSEFVEKLEFCSELHTEIMPDSSVNDLRDFKGLLFSIY